MYCGLCLGSVHPSDVVIVVSREFEVDRVLWLKALSQSLPPDLQAPTLKMATTSTKSHITIKSSERPPPPRAANREDTPRVITPPAPFQAYVQTKITLDAFPVPRASESARSTLRRRGRRTASPRLTSTRYMSDRGTRDHPPIRLGATHKCQLFDVRFLLSFLRRAEAATAAYRLASPHSGSLHA